MSSPWKSISWNHKKTIWNILLYSLIFYCISVCSQGRLCDHNLTVRRPKYLLHGRRGLVVVTGKPSLNNGPRVLPHHTFSPSNNNNNNNNGAGPFSLSITMKIIPTAPGYYFTSTTPFHLSITTTISLIVPGFYLTGSFQLWRTITTSKTTQKKHREIMIRLNIRFKVHICKFWKMWIGWKSDWRHIFWKLEWTHYF